jgi:FkbM family methyltransferase
MRIITKHLSTKKVSLRVPDISSFFLYAFSNWEPELQYYIDNYLGDGDVIEIGAHIGYETLYMAEKVKENKRVIAFEPSPKTFLLLKENCEQFHNIETIEKALSDKTETQELLTFNLFSAWNTLGNKARFPRFFETVLSPEKSVVEKTTLDDFISRRDDIKPSFIKIDVENFEYQVLKGGYNTIKKFKPIIAFEGGDLNRDERYSTKQILKLLEGYNYKAYIYNKEIKSITSDLPSDFSKSLNILALPI